MGENVEKIDREGILRNWPDYEVEQKIGHGASANVYRIRKNNLSEKIYSAVKVIHIPKDQETKDKLLSEGLTRTGLREYCDDMVKDILNENRRMEQLKSAANVITVEDLAIEKNEDDIGYTVFIKMELLEALDNILKDYELEADDIAALGLDICDGLIECEKRKIVHRDIKPANIFVDQYGTYKLGDFGIAREMQNSQTNMTQVGTSMYMAPELVKVQKSDNRVDIYSLGIVLYRLANKGCFPFTTPATTRPMDRQNALLRRLSGETLPLPSDVDEELGRIILKACAYRPEDRYANASELKKDLEHWKFGKSSDKETGKKKKISENIHYIKEKSERTNADLSTMSQTKSKETAKNTTSRGHSSNFGKKLIFILAGAAIFAVILIMILTSRNSGDQVDETGNELLIEATTEKIVEDTGQYDESEPEIEDTEAEKTTEVAGTTETAEASTVSLAEASVGDVVQLGTYEQDGDKKNGKEEVEWIVLDKRDGELLLLSKYGLSNQPYHKKNELVTWEESSLRTWLNEYFYEKAFDSDDKKLIQKKNVSADVNPEYETEVGKSTKDSVFLLSYAQVTAYLDTEEDRKCIPTVFAKSSGIYVSDSNKTCGWWLRTPGAECCGMIVNTLGKIYTTGNRVNLSGNAVRPAIWVKQ